MNLPYASRRTLLILWLWPGTWLLAQQTPLPEVTETLVLTDVWIVAEPGAAPTFGHVLIDQGLIQAVGPDAAIPPQARRIAGDSMYVYAGFISGYSEAAIQAPESDDNQDRPDDPGNPPPALAGITPERQAGLMLDPSDKDLEDLRAAGFTMLHVAPEGGVFPGQGAIIFTAGETATDLLYRDQVAMLSAWDGARRVYPSNLLGVTATWRQHFAEAKYGLEHLRAYGASPQGKARPKIRPQVEALFGVVEQQQPVMFIAEELLELHRALNLSGELGFRLMLAEVKQGWDLIPDIQDRDIPVFLSLELPDGADEAESLADPDTIDNEIQREAARLARRKQETIAQHVGQAAAFAQAGVPFGFATAVVKPKAIYENLQLMQQAGLDSVQALAALTTVPAQWLGLDAVTGTITPGKLANLVVMDVPFGAEDAQVRMTFVEGQEFSFEGKKKSKADPNAEPADIVGRWRYEVETPQGTNEGYFVFEGEPGAYEGHISNDRMPEEVEMDDIEVNGNVVTFSYTIEGGGRSVTVEVEMEVDGDAFTGRLNLGQFGSYDMEGKKEPGR